MLPEPFYQETLSLKNQRKVQYHNVESTECTYLLRYILACNILQKKSSSKASEPKLPPKDANAKVIALSLASFEALDVYQLSVTQSLK